MLEDARALCPEDLYLEIDTLTAYAHNQQKKAHEMDIFTEVGVVAALICGVAITLAAIALTVVFLRRKKSQSLKLE